MEDVARLAVIEQSVGDLDLFRKTLYSLLEQIRLILENPHDYQRRTIRCGFLNNCLEVDSFTDYLKYVGFKVLDEGLVYPDGLGVNKLRLAEEAILRKLRISCGSKDFMSAMSRTHSQAPTAKIKFETVYILKTHNPFLLTIQSLFNEVLKYEDEEIQRLAREHVPVGLLQTAAVKRMREYQRKIKTGKALGKDMKTGKIPGPDLCYDVAFLHELVAWFKESFFTWVDRPPCDLCGGDTRFAGTEVRDVKIELYNCKTCPGQAQFPRHKDCRALLASRRGRCGEWADCFALLCVSLGYETRHVYDTTDHVWCEVFDYDSGSWLHVDPCEGAVDTPLVYEAGWGKSLEYVIACSRDDLQDVTWRYTSDHATVRSRRRRCSEAELIDTIVKLRSERQRRATPPRRRYLARRTLAELAQLMIQKKPSDYESHGRISGSKEWRTERGEIGAKGHTFEIKEEGSYVISYITAIDKYTVTRDNVELESIDGWEDGAYSINNIFRKEEKDWKMVYLAREEGSEQGEISWRFTAAEGIKFDSLKIAFSSALYEDGVVEWSVQFDDEDPQVLDKEGACFSRAFVAGRVAARVRGGRGREAWQHAQLLRQPAAARRPALELTLSARASSCSHSPAHAPL